MTSTIQNLIDNASVIHYASTLPSTGKTHWAIEQLVQKVKRKIGITFYVAPTRILLEEVEAKILRKLRAASQQERVHLVLSGYGDGGESVKRRLELLVAGGKNIYHQRVAPAENGTLILCTHEAFINLDHGCKRDEEGQQIGYSFRRRAQVSVYFDEARKCSLDNQKFHIPIHITQALFAKYLRFADTATAIVPKYRRLMLRNAKLDTTKFDELFNSSKGLRGLRDKIRNLLHTLDDDCVHLYASIDTEVDPGAEIDDNDSRGTYTVLQTILVPYHIFSGWKNVVLLSAFFEDSQMYHLLKTMDVSPKQEGETKKAYGRRITDVLTQDRGASTIILKDITPRVMSSEREKQVLARYKKTCITYLSPNISFGQRHLSNGVMIDSSVLRRFDLKEFFTKLRDLTDELQRVRGGARLPFKQVIRAIAKGRYSEEEVSLVEHVQTLPGLVTRYTPLQWYCVQAIKMSKQWLKEQKISSQPLPITVNVGTKGKAGAESYWKREVVRVVKDGQNVIQMPFASHGLNSYSHLDIIAFLATLNPSPEVVKLFEQLCPDYNAALDHTLDQCVQSAARCSIRDVDSNTKPLIIVTDKFLAEKVKNQLRGLPTIIPPSYFDVPSKDPIFQVVDATAPQRAKKFMSNPVNAARIKEQRKQKRQDPKNIAWQTYLLEHSRAASRYGTIRSSIPRLRKSDPENPKITILQGEYLLVKDQRLADIKRLKPLFEKEYGAGGSSK